MKCKHCGYEPYFSEDDDMSHKCTKGTEFNREPRYVVFKINDIEKYLTQRQKESLMSIGGVISCGRANDGKAPFNAAVVEEDWPEFEMVWDAIEKRMTSNEPR